MTSVRKKSICWLCIVALVVTLVGVLPSKDAYGYTFTPVVVNGECENGYVDDGAAYYTFNLQQNGLARVDVSTTGDVGFILSNSTDFRYTVDLSDSGYAELPLGDYYIKVEGTGDFSVAVGFSPLNEYDEEPNNSMDTAIEMVSGKTYKGHVYYSYSDVDWYKLVVETRSIVHFYLDQPSGTTAYVYDENGNWVNYINGCASGLTTPVYGMQPGTYFIQIQPGYERDYNYIFSARIVEYPTVNEISNIESMGLGKAKVTWTESKYAEGYWLYKENIDTKAWSYVADLPAGTLSYVDYNAPYPGNSCIYHVCAYRYDPKDPYNPYLEILSEETNEGTLYEAKASAPKNVKAATLNGNTVKLSWSAVSDAAGYKVYRKANAGVFKLVKTVQSAAICSWQDQTVKKGTNYTYKVLSYYKDYSGKYYNSGYTATVSAKLAGTIAKPENVKVKKTAQANKVTWGKVRTATGYKIYRKVGAGKYQLVKTTTSADTLTYNDKTVKNGQKYTYKVKAYYKNYTLNQAGKYTSKDVNSKDSKIVTIKR